MALWKEKVTGHGPSMASGSRVLLHPRPVNGLVCSRRWNYHVYQTRVVAQFKWHDGGHPDVSSAVKYRLLMHCHFIRIVQTIQRRNKWMDRPFITGDILPPRGPSLSSLPTIAAQVLPYDNLWPPKYFLRSSLSFLFDFVSFFLSNRNFCEQ